MNLTSRLPERAALAALAAVAAVAFLWAATPARADFHSNPLFPIGEAAGMMGGAAAASVDDGSSTWYNPAGLGSVREQGISASLSAYGIQNLEVPAFTEFSPGQRAGLRSTAVATFPSYLGYVQPFGSPRFRHSLGLSIVVPDFERADAVLDVPTGAVPLEFKARLKHTSQTIWAVPGWGACWAGGRVCAGWSVALAYRTLIETVITDYRIARVSNTTLSMANTNQRDLWLLLVAGQVGVQWQIAQRLRFGASVRSPVKSVAAGGSVLEIESSTSTNAAGAPDMAAIRRIEDQRLRMDYRLPLQARAGFSLDLGPVRLSADANVSPAQPSFAFIRGRNGENQLQPTNPNGTPSGDPIVIGEDLARELLIDGALGLSVRATDRWSLLCGGFTNFTGAAEGSGDAVWGDRFGVTLGLSRRGTKSTTRLGLTGTAGFGKVTGFDATGMIKVDSRSFGIYATIGGTADF